MLSDHAASDEPNNKRERRIVSCNAPFELLAVDFLAMSDAKNEDDEPVVYKFTDKVIVTDAVPPILSELRSLKRFSNTARIVQSCHAFV